MFLNKYRRGAGLHDVRKTHSKKNKNKIISRVFGGLGNQLFGYTAARRLALVNDAELVIDHVSGFAHDQAYQRHYQLDHFQIPCRKATSRERLEPFSRIRRYLLRRWNALFPFEMRSYLRQEGVDFDPRLLNVRACPTLYLEGYWQSEGYFKDVEDQIRNDLTIIPPSDSANRVMAEQIGRHEAVAVHVRFFDEPEAHGERPAGSLDNNASGDYYRRAIWEMEQRVSGAHYYLFSDRPEAARARIPLPDERITLVHHNQGDAMAYADLWLMTQCKHFIIANSTFSWWGAWLANNPRKTVIAPGFEKRDGKMWWGFDGLIPEAWLKC